MKLRAMLMGLALCLASSISAVAQDHGEVGAYGEYFRFQGLQANLLGVGARLSINALPRVQIEGELGYLFRRGFTENFSNGIPGNVSTSASNVKVLHGLFGPKLQFTKGAARFFVVAKGGFFNTEINGLSPGSGFTSQINNLRTDNVSAVAYPGGGAEAYLGPIGLRFDIGDEIVFSGKANHNLRITFGPHIRF